MNHREDPARIAWLAGLGILMAGLLIAVPARSARTGLWELSGIEAWLQGEFDGTGLTSEGRVISTFSADRIDLPARLVWGAARVEGGHLVATSLPATVTRREADGEMHRLVETRDLGFTALARAGGRIYVGATPSGRLYRYEPEDDSLRSLTTLPDSYVWSLQPDPRGDGLYVGTGPEGRLYHLSPDGSVREVASVSGYNVLSTTVFRGRLYVGDDFGGLYRLTENDTLESVYGYRRGEVAALAQDGRFLYVAVNLRQGAGGDQQQQKTASELASQLRQESLHGSSVRAVSAGETRAQRGTVPTIQAVRARSLQRPSRLFEGLSGTLVYRMDPPRRMNIVYDDPGEIVHDLEAADGSLFVATGGKGRLYEIREDFTRIAYYKSPHRLVLNVGLRDGRPAWLTTGEGGALTTRRSPERREHRYTSPVLDGQLLSRWGRLTLRGRGGVRVRTRAGNTNRPDTRWSPWSSWSDARALEVPSRPARFLQVQVRLEGPSSSLNRLEVAYRMPNQRPRISEFAVSPNPVSARLFQRRSVVENESGGPGSNSAGAGQGSSGSLKQRQVRWKVVDPDGDPARVRLFYRVQGDDRWISFTGDQYISEDHYALDLRDLADGRYELRLVASDRPFNDPGEGFTVEEVSEPLLVDNTPPAFEDWSAGSSRVSFRTVDGESRIVFVQYRINGRPWNGLTPEDDIYDEPVERFTFSPAGSPSEGDLLEVRMMDEGGNTATARHTFR